jgi:predicted dinucleotide-binding enzyme
MKIGIIGSGVAGQTLGKGFVRIGHHVMLGSRTPAKLRTWQEEAGPRAAIGSPMQAAHWAELVVLSVKGDGMANAIEVAGADRFDGKIVIDASDPLDFSSGRPGMFVGCTDSLGERVQRQLPKAKVVKALNIVAADVMVNPAITGGEPDMFIAGNDEAAKRVVTGLLTDFGWKKVIDLGDIQNARSLEALSLMWVIHSHRTGKQHHAFKLING